MDNVNEIFNGMTTERLTMWKDAAEAKKLYQKKFVSGTSTNQSIPSTTYPSWYQPYRPSVCPGCGRCDHCGRGGPYWIGYPRIWM